MGRIESTTVAAEPTTLSRKAIIGMALGLLGVVGFVAYGTVSPAHSATATTSELLNDLKGTVPEVPGYTCGTMTNSPCSPIGGKCESGWLGLTQNCKCKPGYHGNACDWGPTATPPQQSTESLKRINMAYSFSAAIYYDTDTMLDKCPGFKTGAESSGVITVKNADANTVAGGSWVLPDHSPSGHNEVMFGFRGTMFSSAMNEVTATMTGGKVHIEYAGLKTVLSDLNIAAKNLEYTDPKTGKKIDLGMVHKGFYDAVAPFLDQLLPVCGDYISKLREITKQNGVEPIVTVTGHSLGAALATIFASVLRVVYPDIQLHLVTFGAPRVGSPLWVKNFETQQTGLNGEVYRAPDIIRMVNGDDVISLIPTSIGEFDSVMHAGPQLTLNFTSVPKNCRSLINIGSMYTGLLANMNCAVSSVNDYHLNYRPNIDRFLQAQGAKDSSEWCREDAVLGF